MTGSECAMQVKEAIEQRRSIRKFKEDPVAPSVLEELLEAARLAPSGSNIQPWRFQAVTSGDMRTKLAACTFRLNFIAEAPITMVCCADSKALETRKRRVNELVVSGAFQGTGLEDISLSDYPDSSRRSDAANQAYVNLNVAIAIEHMVLRSVELGLGSCWTMLFEQHGPATAQPQLHASQHHVLYGYGYIQIDIGLVGSITPAGAIRVIRQRNVFQSRPLEGPAHHQFIDPPLSRFKSFRIRTTHHGNRGFCYEVQSKCTCRELGSHVSTGHRLETPGLEIAS